MKFPFALLFAHARRNWFRSLLTVLSVFVAIAIFGFLRTFIVGMESALEASSNRKLVVQSAISLFQTLPTRLGPELEAEPEVEAVDAWTWFGGVYIDDSPEHYWGRFGVDPKKFRQVYGDEVELSEEAWTQWFTTPTACIVGDGLAQKEGFKVGKIVTLTGNLWPGRLDLQVVGIYKSLTRAFDDQTMFLHWDYMNEQSKQLGGRREQVSTYTLLLKDAEAGPRLRSRIDANYESSDYRTRTLTLRAFQSQFHTMWGNLPLFFTVIGTVVMIACLMVTANTMVLNARERVREVGILKTLGFSPFKVASFTLIESLVLCLLGGALAMLLIMPLDGKQLIFVIASVPPQTLVEGLSLAALLGLLSGIVPAWIAQKLSIVEAIRRQV